MLPLIVSISVHSHSLPVFLVSSFFSFSEELVGWFAFFLSSSSFSSSSSSLSDMPDELSASFSFLVGLVTYESHKTPLTFCTKLTRENNSYYTFHKTQ